MPKTAFTLMVIIMLVSFSIPLFLMATLSYAGWIDTLFLVSLFVTMLGALLYIIGKGFLDPFIQNFKYFLKKVNKGREMADEIEQKHPDTSPIKPRSFRITFPCLVAGGILLIVSIFFSIIQ